MRIVISAPRKSGGAQLRCLLGMAYELKSPPTSAPAAGDAAVVSEWVAGLSEKSVSTCDLPYTALNEAASAARVHLIGVIRHPFDLFVSNFDVAQQRAARGHDDDGDDRAWNILTGEALDGEIAQSYAATDFAREIGALRDWAIDGDAIRYEDLLAAPDAVLHTLSRTHGPLTVEQIAHAVRLCPAENIVASRPGKGRRMPALPPGAWRERLPLPLLDTLRHQYGVDVAMLGYDAS